MGTVGHFLLILAYQRAPAATLTPYLYAQIVFAMLRRLARLSPRARRLGLRRHGDDRGLRRGRRPGSTCASGARAVPPPPSTRTPSATDARRPGTDNPAHGAILRGPSREPAAAPAQAGRRRSCTRGGIAAIPTDSSYALVCHLDDKAAVENLRRIRGVDDKHHLTLAVPRPERTGQLRARRQPPVPAAEARHAGAVHLHPRGDQGGAAPRLAIRAQHHRPARARPPRDCRNCSPLHRRAAARHHADRARRERAAERRRRRSASASRSQVQAVVDAGACPMRSRPRWST